MNRIDNKFEHLRKINKKALITFITAGDPNLKTTEQLVLAMEKAGADIIELGIPYSDPLADGEVIQASSNRALKNGATIKNIMDCTKNIRQKTDIPLIYLVYYNSIYKYGMDKFLKQASDSGIDGLIIPDLPIEERADILAIAEKYNLYLIPLVAPNSKERIEKITKNAKGFIYCVSVLGVTGTRTDINTNVESYMKLVSSFSNIPKALGFGISTKEMAEKYAPYCQGIIVGSAVIKKIAASKSSEEAINNVYSFVKELSFS